MIHHAGDPSLPLLVLFGGTCQSAARIAEQSQLIPACQALGWSIAIPESPGPIWGPRQLARGRCVINAARVATSHWGRLVLAGHSSGAIYVSRLAADVVPAGMWCNAGVWDGTAFARFWPSPVVVPGCRLVASYDAGERAWACQEAQAACRAYAAARCDTLELRGSVGRHAWDSALNEAGLAWLADIATDPPA